MKKLHLLCLMSLLFIVIQAQNSNQNKFLFTKSGNNFLSATTGINKVLKSRVDEVLILKTINLDTAGTLDFQLTSSEKKTITDLTITGSIDARDFKIMRDSMPDLARLNLKAATIASYTGAGGTYYSNTLYPANEIPENAFYISEEEPGIVKSGLTTILLPSTTTSVGRMAFTFCSSLDTVSISPSITQIGQLAFVGCSAMINVDQDNPYYSSVDGLLFDKAKTTMIQCPLSISGNFDIPSTVNSIGIYGFCFCDKLSSVNIPSSVETIGMFAFTSCSGMINIDTNNPNYASLDGVLFNKSLNLLIQCPTSKSGSYIIPSLVDSLNDISFYNCSLLTAVTLPSSISYVGDQTFYNCSGLTSITVNSLPVSLASAYNVFYGVNRSTCILNVPFGAKPLYLSASVWNSFTNIVENPHGFILTTNKLILSSVAGSNAAVNISTNDAWTAVSDQSWLTVSPENGMGNDTILLTAGANPSTDNRTAVVTVSGEGIQTQTIQVIQSGIPKTLNLTAGGLLASMTADELSSVINLKLSGTIDARDFKTMRDNMPKLTFLDISTVNIVAYNGLVGTVSWITSYPANKIPDYAFNTGASSQQYTLASVNLPATITAIGDYAFYSCEALTEIIIPNPVTYIGNSAFGSCNSLANVILPDSITNIENSAFMGCAISEITIPNKVLIIGQYGFGYCKKLRAVNIPNSVTTILNSAFENCTALTELTIGNSVTYIGNSAFRGCSSLPDIVIPNSIKILEGFVFGSCSSLKSVTLPDSLTTIGYYCFNNCTQLTDIIIPNFVTKIDYAAFSNCSSLTNIIIPNSVTFIGYSAFSYCSALTTFTIPNSVIKIESAAFDGCTGLTSINVNKDVPLNLSGTNSVFNDVDKTLCILNVPYGSKKLYETAYQWQEFVNIVENIHGFTLSSDSVKIMSTEGSQAFVNITANEQWSVTSNQTWLKINPETGIGNDSLKFTAEANLSSLKRNATVTVMSGEISKTITVIQAASPKILNIIAGGLASALTADELSSIAAMTITGSIDARDFKTLRDKMPQLENLGLSAVSIVSYSGSEGTVNYNTTYEANDIPQYAFFNSNSYAGKAILKTIILPETATSIGYSAFERCSGLTDIKISNSVKSIAAYAFKNCSGLRSIIMSNSIKSIDDYTFLNCTGLTDLVVPDSVSKVGRFSFGSCTNLKRVTLGNSLSVIDYGAFQNCTSLTDVIMKNSLKTIGDQSFEKTGLTNLIIPESVTSIGYSSFNNCTQLIEVVLPNSLTEIGSSAFSNCTGLTKITLGNTLTKINRGLFYNCTNLTNIDIPGSVTSIESTAFMLCSSLTKITIPNSVTSIGSEAFRSCTGLTTISIPESVTRIDWRSFYSCTSLTSIYALPLIPVDLSSAGMSIDVFYDVDKTNCLLHVPYQTKALYAAAIQWKDFINIVENPYGLKLESNNVKLLATEGSNTSIKIFSNYDWTVSSDNEWLNVTPQSGTGNNSITLTAQANLSILIRKATITVSVPGVLPKTITVTQAALPKIINNTAGGLLSCLTTDELNTVSNLVVTGTLDARDFRLMRDAMPLLSILDIGNVTIIAYKGIEGTYGSYNYNYPANEIPQNSFYHNNKGKVSLTSVILPSTATSLGDAAFTLCIGLDSIEIPDLVTELTWNVFSYCKGLKKVTFGKSVKKIDYGAFEYCTSLSSLIIPNSVTLIGFQSFNGCSGLTNVFIPNSVTSLDYESFNDCTGLVDIIIPNSVITIGYHSFNGCTNLKKVSIPNSVTSIGGSAFGNCTALTDVSLGNSVTLIDFEAFYNCSSLTSINIPNSVITINGTAFKFCKNLTNITIGNSVTSIGSEAFRECTGLTTVSIPASVTEIDWYAFYSCTNLKSIYAYSSKPVDLSLYGSGSIFYNVNKTTCTLYVPQGSKALYQASVQWKDFTNIIEMTTALPALTDSKFSIYPNPIKESFRVDGLNENANLSIRDQNGKVVFSKLISGNETVSVGELPQGLYFVRIMTSEGATERKMIKK